MIVMTTAWVREAMTDDERRAFRQMRGTGQLSLLASKPGGPYIGRMYHPVTHVPLRAESGTLAGVLEQLTEKVAS